MKLEELYIAPEVELITFHAAENLALSELDPEGGWDSGNDFGGSEDGGDAD